MKALIVCLLFLSCIPAWSQPCATLLAEAGVEHRVEETARLLRQKMGSATVWGGIEVADPITQDLQYRWNSLDDTGLRDKARREKFISVLTELGIKNVRFGLVPHEIKLNDPRTWKVFDDIIGDFRDAGIKISLDLHHFGIEDRFLVDKQGNQIKDLSLFKDGKNRDLIDWEHSYYLNPEWPEYFAKYALQAYKRYHDKVAAFTIINEPEPTVGFNSQYWHGGHPGWNNSNLHFRFYIERGLRVGEAAVRARLAIEEYAQKIHERPLFVHTEAVTIKPRSWVEFNKYVRFFPSDTILGADWIVNADLESLKKMSVDELRQDWEKKSPDDRTSLDWTVHTFIFDQPPEKWAQAKELILDRLSTLKTEHLKLAKFKMPDGRGMTMRDYTVYGTDYYAQNEDPDQDGHPPSMAPRDYEAQVQKGSRLGIGEILIQYYRRYRMPMMVTETSTPEPDQAEIWYLAMAKELLKAAAAGVPIKGLTIYPLIDTVGWEHALSRIRQGSLVNPSGLMTQDYQPRPFAFPVLKQLQNILRPLIKNPAPNPKP